MRYRPVYTVPSILILGAVIVAFYLYFFVFHAGYVSSSLVSSGTSSAALYAQNLTQQKISPTSMVMVEGDAAQMGMMRGKDPAVYDSYQKTCLYYDLKKNTVPADMPTLPTILLPYLDELSGIATSLTKLKTASPMRSNIDGSYEHLQAWNDAIAYSPFFQSVCITLDASITGDHTDWVGYLFSVDLSKQFPSEKKADMSDPSWMNRMVGVTQNKPTEGKPYLALGPLFLNGVIAGINRDGLMVALISNENYDPQPSIPPTFIVKMLLQYVSSRNDAYTCLFNPKRYFQERLGIVIPETSPFPISGKFLILDTNQDGSVFTVSTARKQADELHVPNGYKIVTNGAYTLSEGHIAEQDLVFRRLDELWKAWLSSDTIIKDPMKKMVEGFNVIIQESFENHHGIMIFFHPHTQTIYVPTSEDPTNDGGTLSASAFQPLTIQTLLP